MKVYRNIEDFVKLKNAVVTIGTFDGVHLGHRKIIRRLKELAAEKGGESVILTFFPHPRMILHPEDESLKLINTINEKTALIEALGVDHLIITPFTRDFSILSPEEYIREILINKIGTGTIVIGYDHRFGKDRQGDFRLLESLTSKYKYDIEEIPEQDMHHIVVSSTKVRDALLSGDVKTAADFLSYPFSIEGTVIRGDQIGRTIGYPTANIVVEESYKLIPGDGIYAVTVDLPGEGSFKGMAYIGKRPTVNGTSKNIEVNLFNFDKEIYGIKIRIMFQAYLRGDMKFRGLEALKEQINRDREAALAFFNV